MVNTLVDHNGRPFAKAEIERFTDRAGGLTLPLLPGSNPMMYEDEFANYNAAELLDVFLRPRDVEDEIATYAETISNVPGVYNERFAKRNPISDLNIPKDIMGIFTLSMRYAEDHYIVNRCIKIKKNFATREMTLLGKDTTRTYYEALFRKLRMRQLLSQVFRYYWITGRVVIYWGSARPIEGLCMLDPRYIIVRRFLTKCNVFLRPKPRWVSILQERQDSPEFRFLKQNLPSYWIPFIMRNEEIPLKDDEFALIENDLSLFNVRSNDEYAVHGSPLSAAFRPLQIASMLMAGDFSVAWMIKNLVALISIGDPKNEKEYTPPDQTALQKLATAFIRPEYAMNAFVDPTVNIRYITPDPNLFDNKKYLQVTTEIEYVLGVPGCFTTGTGDFASNSMSLKPFREDIQVGRQDVMEQFFWKFLPIAREGVSTRKTGNDDPEIEWDNDCLKDDKIIQDELNGKWDRGAISNRSLLEGKARDFDTELERKKDEVKDANTLLPLYSIAQGTDLQAIIAAGKLAANPPQPSTNKGTGGRPAGNNPKPSRETGNNPQSRPSRPS